MPGGVYRVSSLIRCGGGGDIALGAPSPPGRRMRSYTAVSLPSFVCYSARVAGFLFQRHGTHRPADATQPLPPGFYAPSIAPCPVAWAVVRCPTCGKLSTVGINHTVNADGRVRPSYVCPFPPCSFHVMARLVGWRP